MLGNPNQPRCRHAEYSVEPAAGQRRRPRRRRSRKDGQAMPHRIRILTGLVGLGVMMAALAAGPAPAQSSEVVVYSARHYGQEAAYDAFTKKTGITLKILNGSTGELVERLKAEGARTPADILLTVDAGNLWNAARAELLSPVASPELAANIPAHLRDPENRWVGLTVRARTIVYNKKKVTASEVPTYESLGDPKWKGRLC